MIRDSIFTSKKNNKDLNAWFEKFPSSFDGKQRTTSVILKKQKMLPYWSQNSLKNEYLREELGLR